MKTFEELYPGEADQDYFGVYSYQPIIDSFGKVLVQVDDQDYQGDSRVLLKRDGMFGFLNFGWGSCSGCDALQSCESPEEVMDLVEKLAMSINWGTPEDVYEYFTKKDWKGDYSYNQEETQEFIRSAMAFMEGYIWTTHNEYGSEVCFCPACCAFRKAEFALLNKELPFPSPGIKVRVVDYGCCCGHDAGVECVITEVAREMSFKVENAAGKGRWHCKECVEVIQ